MELDPMVERLHILEKEGREREEIYAKEKRACNAALNGVMVVLAVCLCTAEAVADKATKADTKDRRAARATSSAVGRLAARLTSREFKKLATNVANRLDLDGSVTKDQVFNRGTVAQLNVPAMETALHRLYAMKDRIAQHTTDLKGPTRCVTSLKARILHRKSKCHTGAIEYGGVTFKDAQATDAWFQLLRDKEVNTLAPYMVTLLSSLNHNKRSHYHGERTQGGCQHNPVEVHHHPVRGVNDVCPGALPRD